MPRTGSSASGMAGVASPCGIADPRSGRVTAILDFEFAGTDFRAQDISAAVENTSHGGHRFMPVLREKRDDLIVI